MKFKKEVEIDVRKCVRALRRKWKFLLVMAIIFFAISVAITLEEKEDEYSATASVYSVAAGSYVESMSGTSAMNSYKEVAKSYKVFNRAALILGREDVDAEYIKEAIEVKSIGSSSTAVSTYLSQDSSIIEITSTTSDPEISMQLADAVAEAFIMEMENVVGSGLIKSLDSAYTYEQISSGFVECWKLRIIITFGGVALMALMIVVLEIFNSKANTVRECSLNNGLPVIGVIPEYK